MADRAETALARDIIEEQFGPMVLLVADLLIQRFPGHATLEVIMRHCTNFDNPSSSSCSEQGLKTKNQGRSGGLQKGIPTIVVRQALLVLLRHNLLDVTKKMPLDRSSVGPLEYGIKVFEVNRRVHLPAYGEQARERFGEAAAAIVDELAVHGQRRRSDLINAVTTALDERDQAPAPSSMPMSPPMQSKHTSPRRSGGQSSKPKKRKKEYRDTIGSNQSTSSSSSSPLSSPRAGVSGRTNQTTRNHEAAVAGLELMAAGGFVVRVSNWKQHEAALDKNIRFIRNQAIANARGPVSSFTRHLLPSSSSASAPNHTHASSSNSNKRKRAKANGNAVSTFSPLPVFRSSMDSSISGSGGSEAFEQLPPEMRFSARTKPAILVKEEKSGEGKDETTVAVADYNEDQSDHIGKKRPASRNEAIGHVLVQDDGDSNVSESEIANERVFEHEDDDMSNEDREDDEKEALWSLGTASFDRNYRHDLCGRFVVQKFRSSQARIIIEAMLKVPLLNERMKSSPTALSKDSSRLVSVQKVYEFINADALAETMPPQQKEGGHISTIPESGEKKLRIAGASANATSKSKRGKKKNEEQAKGTPLRLVMERDMIIRFLQMMDSDSANIISRKVGAAPVAEESRVTGLTEYSVNVNAIMRCLRDKAMVSILTERYDSEDPNSHGVCARIYQVLQTVEFAEQNQIAELAMIPMKDARIHLYKMYKDKYITYQEVPRREHGPAETMIFLWCINGVQEDVQKSMNIIDTVTEMKQQKRAAEVDPPGGTGLSVVEMGRRRDVFGAHCVVVQDLFRALLNIRKRRRHEMAKQTALGLSQTRALESKELDDMERARQVRLILDQLDQVYVNICKLLRLFDSGLNS